MNDNADKSINDLLKAFISSTDEDADNTLAELYRSGIEPLVSAVLRQKLHISLRPSDENYINQIGLDLLGEMRATFLPVLRRLRSASNAEIVENFKGYVRTAALNAYRQYLRDKYPDRLRLRNKVRYILTCRPGFAIWKDERGTSLCGLSEWIESDTPCPGAGALEAIQVSLSESTDTPGSLDNNAAIIGLIGSIFEQTKAPVAFEDLVSMIWQLLGLREPQQVSETDGILDAVPTKEKSVEEKLDDRLSLEHMWQKICEMPLRHRLALLLNLHDETGDNLLALFPRLGIASIRQIAATLEYEPEELAAIWSELPLDDNTIAERMGLNRQQVINLRQSARASLRRRLL